MKAVKYAQAVRECVGLERSAHMRTQAAQNAQRAGVNNVTFREFDIVGDTDDLFYDAARKRLYVSGGEGYIDVFQEQDAGRFGRVAHMATAAGARTSLFVPDQSRLYLAVPHRGNQKAEVRIYEAR